MDVVRGVGKASDKVKGVEEDELQYKAHKARASQSNRLCRQGDKRAGGAIKIPLRMCGRSRVVRVVIGD